jgi:hypothetical protein
MSDESGRIIDWLNRPRVTEGEAAVVTCVFIVAGGLIEMLVVFAIFGLL